MTRDNQKSRVYAAEQFVRRTLDMAHRNPAASVITMFGSTLVLPDERRFGDVAGVQRYVDQVLALDWVRDLWPTRSRLAVTVRPRQGTTKAHYEVYSRTIAVPSNEERAVTKGGWALREIVVLHELAHHLSRDGAAHGAQFCGDFLYLVERIIGHEVGLLLYSALHEEGASICKRDASLA